MRKYVLTGLACLALADAGAASRQPAEPPTERHPLASIQPRQGKIVLAGNIASLDLPSGFVYLDADDSSRLLEAWGNPPAARTLGMIVPAGVNPLSIEGWGVVITYDQDGHVRDDDADRIDYTKLLKEMQDGLEQENAARRQQGYRGMTLVGWAEAPHYDKASHKLYWAKELRSEGEAQHGLNYNVRVLGREGVLVLNAVAGVEQLGRIKAEMQKITAITNFTEGNRYADFDAGTDKMAEYGIAALVAGGVAAKLGLFGKLVSVLLAFKTLLAAGVAAAGSAAWKLFRRTPATESNKVDLGKH